MAKYPEIIEMANVLTKAGSDTGVSADRAGATRETVAGVSIRQQELHEEVTIHEEEHGNY